SANYSSDNNPCENCHGKAVSFTDTFAPSNSNLNSSNNKCYLYHTTLHGEGRPGSKQTKASLAKSSFCYSCHWAYPHPSYSVPSFSTPAAPVMPTMYGWGPTMANKNVISHKGVITGHVLYIRRNPLFADVQGQRWPNVTSIIGLNATKNTCGGSTGMCHNAGKRSTVRDLRNENLCNGYCHK
ncbi:hypothetical protein WDW86_21530, partial [Bdellovibrionota bacterium FG-2]